MTNTSVAAILVEDSQTIHDTLVPALEELGNTRVVAWARSAKEAGVALNQWKEHWHLIIIDLFLASGSGLEVLQLVAERSPEQYAIVLTNYATPEMRRRCMDLRADDVFDKSTELDAFLDRCIEISLLL